MNIHFIIKCDITYEIFLSIYSSYILYNEPKLFIHYTGSNNISTNFEYETLKLLRNIKFVAIDQALTDDIEISLDILYNFGGIVYSNYILCYKSFESFLEEEKIPIINKELIFFKSADTKDNLLNIVMYGKKKSPTIQEYKRYYLEENCFNMPKNMVLGRKIKIIDNSDALLNIESIDKDINKNNVLLFHFDCQNYDKVNDNHIYQSILSNIKNRMVVRTPINDSFYYALADLIINTNNVDSDLSTEQTIKNTDILSINLAKVYSVAKDQIKKDITEQIKKNPNIEYSRDKIIEIINTLYNTNFKIIEASKLQCKQEITKLKRCLINIIDNYYVTIR